MIKTVSLITLIYLVFPQNLPTTLGASTRREELTVDKANDYIANNKDSVDQTYRFKYHLQAPIGWINDPNGFIYFRGEYHLFYQLNPYGSLWDRMHWGHAKSKDFIHWVDLPVALAPDKDYDWNGAFSGSAIEKDGKLYLMYTGNTDQRQVQNIAVSEDGIHFEKINENPVLNEKDLPSNARPEDFRDPKVFQRDDKYYSVIASKTHDNTGQILLYESNDLISWKFKSILLEGTKDQGVMFECPDLFELDGRDILIISVDQMPRSGNDYHNGNVVVVFTGKVDWEKGNFNVETTKELDHGMDFYATQTTVGDENRRIAATWMNLPGRTYPTHDLGHRWTGGLTLPRELRLRNGYLVQIVPDEIRKAYRNTVGLKNFTLNYQLKSCDKIAGDVAALELVVNLQEARRFTLEVRAGENEKTSIRYDTASKEIELDRSKSGITLSDPFARKVQVPLNDGKLKLQIFLDKSSVEVFVNDGVETLTATIYPTKVTSDKIRFDAEGKAVIESLYFSQIDV